MLVPCIAPIYMRWAKLRGKTVLFADLHTFVDEKAFPGKHIYAFSSFVVENSSSQQSTQRRTSCVLVALLVQHSVWRKQWIPNVFSKWDGNEHWKCRLPLQDQLIERLVRTVVKFPQCGIQRRALIGSAFLQRNAMRLIPYFFPFLKPVWSPNQWTLFMGTEPYPAEDGSFAGGIWCPLPGSFYNIWFSYLHTLPSEA